MAGGQLEPAEARPWRPCWQVLHLDRVCIQEAWLVALFIFHILYGLRKLLDTFRTNLSTHHISDGLYGTWRKASTSKAGWNLPQPKMANTDLSALLKSEAIRAVLRAPNRKVSRAVVRTNPLKNIRSMLQVEFLH